MARLNKEKERLSIDVKPEEHRLIKMYAARRGMSIRLFVLESVRQRLTQAAEEKDLSRMTNDPGSVLKELWDNSKDAEYDKL